MKIINPEKPHEAGLFGIFCCIYNYNVKYMTGKEDACMVKHRHSDSEELYPLPFFMFPTISKIVSVVNSVVNFANALRQNLGVTDTLFLVINILIPHLFIGET